MEGEIEIKREGEDEDGEGGSGAGMSRGGGRPPVLAEDVPWRAPPPGQKPVPRIQLNPVLRVSQNPNSAYAIAVMKVALQSFPDSCSPVVFVILLVIPSSEASLRLCSTRTQSERDSPERPCWRPRDPTASSRGRSPPSSCWA